MTNETDSGWISKMYKQNQHHNIGIIVMKNGSKTHIGIYQKITNKGGQKTRERCSISLIIREIKTKTSEEISRHTRQKGHDTKIYK